MSQLDREELLIDGPVGKLHLLLDHPSTSAKGVAIVSHPQPLLGGSPRHIVPVTLARQLCASGWLVVRPSFRGVGSSEGSHDGGIGETADSQSVLKHMAGHFFKGCLSRVAEEVCRYLQDKLPESPV